MSEIQRVDARATGDLDAASPADRDAKIEQLLLAGLDHYFAARYEHAINVWTRALFFDRNHPRARAYIDRARSALAERQRQSEELLHDGVAAFQRGEGGEARRLLQAAIDGGAPADEAFAVLGRLNRLDVPPPAGIDPAAPAVRSSRLRRRDGGPAGSRPGWWIAGALLAAVVSTGVFAVSTGSAGWAWVAIPGETAAPGAGAPVVRDLSLPLPRHGEIVLSRARALASGGRLHESLALLEEVRPTDPQKADADRLRAEIQRQLLAFTPLPPGSADRRLP